MEPFLLGENVYLRLPCIDKDVDQGNWHSWFSDLTITKFLVHGNFPISRSQQREYVIQAMNDPKTLILSVVDKHSKQHVGVISLKSIDLINRNAEIGIVMGRNPKPGSALEAMSLLLDHAFMRLNLHRVYAGQHEGLWKWVNQLLLIGFQFEGYRKDAGFRSGRYYGVVQTYVISDHYCKIKEQRGGNVLGKSVQELLRNRPTRNLVEEFKAAISKIEYDHNLENGQLN